MKTLVYCMESVMHVVHKATGVYPITCLPFQADTFDVRVFENVDFIWLGLHGIPDNPGVLYGDEQMIAGLPMPLRVEALSVDGIAGLDLGGKVVFATTCHLPATNFPDAFKAAGAAVIGGPGKNFGNLTRLAGADLLGSFFTRSLRLTRDAGDALSIAKARLMDSEISSKETDAMQFEIL